LRIAIFGLGVLAVISLGFILLPHATIRLPLQQRIQSQNINLIVDPHITAVSVSGEIPAARYEKPFMYPVQRSAADRQIYPADMPLERWSSRIFPLWR